MTELPHGSNFYGSLTADLSKEKVAQLYAAEGWSVRKCTWVDFEVRCSWAELIIDGESPILIHGLVADVLTNAEAILAPLRRAGISYSAECYSENDELLQEFIWSSNTGA